MDGRQYSNVTLLEYAAIFSAVLILLRLAWMFPASWASWWVRHHVLKQTDPGPTSKEIFVVGWTGMRGVVALAAAISLPETLGDGRPFAQRNLIIFLTFAVILVTLVLQGLTLPPLIRALGLAKSADSGEEELEARRALAGAAVKHLETEVSKTDDGELKHGYQDLLHRYRHRFAALCDACHATPEMERQAVDRYRKLGDIALSTAKVERDALIRLRDENRIGDDVLRRLQRELDLTETRLTKS
jgi:CPA1 family monovalent cation:H+ antiporter